MGSSSKIILVGATSLVVGIYAISLKKAQADGVEAAMKHVKRVQNERTEDAAMRTAMSDFVKENGAKDKGGTRKALDGSTYTYSVTKIKDHNDPDYPNYRMTVTINRDGVPKDVKSILSKQLYGVDHGARKITRGQWAVTKVFSSHK